MKHLYLHIPFCHRRCSYCDFNTYANMEDRIDAYVDAMCAELAARAGGATPQPGPRNAPDLPALPADMTRADLLPTIFFGGGTPTMLSLDHVERVLEAASALVPLDGAEITMEANPGTVLGRDYLRGLRALGVNRISMGVQSLHDPTLRMLGRIHTADEARRSFLEAREAGFERINLDFIFGLPGQSVQQWAETLDEIVTWGADHFSLYSLILEESTPLYAQVTGGKLAVPDDDVTGEMYEQAMARFGAAGYTQYEISNWALGGEAGHLPRQACHHNLAYWLNADYMAAGAGAHGHVFPQRYFDVLKIDDYIAAARDHGTPTAEINPLDDHDLAVETMFMGLRLNVGISYRHFAERCGRDMRATFGPTLEKLEQRGLLLRDETGVRLSERGRMLGNQVFAEFVD